MNHILRQIHARTAWLSAALIACFLMSAGGHLAGQSPLFSNNHAVYYNPYGRGMYTNNYAQVYGRSFPFQALAAAYSQAIPSANPGFQGASYATNAGYGGSMYIQNSGSGAYYNPYGN
jgi:hypothetical protein